MCGGLRRGFSFGAVSVGKGSDLDLDGNGFVFEFISGEGSDGFFVGIDGELIRLLSGNPEFARKIFRAQAHVDVRVRIMVHEPGIRRDFISAHGHQRHRFRAAGHDDLRGAAPDPFGGQRDRLQAAGAEAIDGHSRSFDRQTRTQSGNARHVHPLLAFRHGAAEDHVVNFLSIQSGNARERFLDDQCGQIVGPAGAQRPFVSASDGCSDGRNDDGFWHDNLFSERSPDFRPLLKKKQIPERQGGWEGGMDSNSRFKWEKVEIDARQVKQDASGQVVIFRGIREVAGMAGLSFLIYPWGLIVQGLALWHFVKRRPANYWIFIIIFGGVLGAAVYVLVEIIPDLGLLRGVFQGFGRRSRIQALETQILDNPSAGNLEELAELCFEQKKYREARQALDAECAICLSEARLFWG